MSSESASSALSRYTIIDLTRVRAGPTCVRQFADWGANVIKVELPESPDGNPSDFGPRHLSDFQNLHRNKRSVTVNLKSPKGIEILHRLVTRADVLVENYRPEVKDRLGIDYESLRAINPRLVYTSISGFGQDGPYRDRPGVDQIAQGMSGLMSVTGAPGQGPMRVGIAVADLAAGLFGALGTLTALLEREVSGEGQWVQSSLLESQIFMMDFQAVRYLMNNDVPGQVGNDHPTSVPMGCFETADGHINIAPMPAAWPVFCEVIGIKELTDHPDFATMPARFKNRALVNEKVAERIVLRDSTTWIDLMNDAGIPCGPIYAVDEVFDDPQVKHLGIAQDVTSKALGAITLLGQPVTLSRTPSKLATATPECGENTNEILSWLGYDDDDIAALRRAGVV